MPTPKRPGKKAGATRTAKQQAAAATSAPADPTPTTATPTTATPTAQDPASGRPNSGRARTKSASAAPKSASAAAKPTPAAAGSASAGSASAPAEPGEARSRRPRVAALLLNAFLVLLGAGLLLGLLYWFEGLPARKKAVSTVAKAPAAQTPQREVPPPPAAPAPPPESLSWQLAERAYRSKDYELARERYGLLLARSAATPANAAVSDFFRFRIGRCLARSGKLEEARALLGSVSHSDSPIVQAAADYDLAVLDYLAGNHLAARAKAYSAVAALAAMEAGFPLETDCDYLAARALTDKALAFHETSLSVPLSHRWQEADVFGGLEQEALRRLLNEGRGGAEQAVLGPQVSKARGPAGASRYSVVCCQGPLEELLQRLSLEAGMEIRWESVAPAARRRTVTLVFKVGSAQRICEVACGGVGLLARFTGEQAIIHDPHACPSLSEQRELLYGEAVSTWRRFLLRSPGDPRLGEGHFAVAALHECFADTSSALREYQLVASRFPKHPVAGLALLRQARLRIRLRDYAGARSDLVELLNLFPGCAFLDEVYLGLAQAALNAGLLEEAVADFQKLYHLDLSLASRKQACLGAAQAHFALGQHPRVCEWLERYLKMCKGDTGDEVAQAYLLMAKSLAAQGNLDQALRAAHCALNVRPSRRQHIQALLAVALIQKDRASFLKAVSALGRIEPASLTSRQQLDYLLTRANLYRAMGLPDKAVAVLRRETPSISDEQMAIQISLEMAHGYAEAGELASARGLLAELLPKMRPGPEATRAGCDLVEMCLADGKAVQAIAIGQALLKSAEPEVPRRVLELLGEAYLAQQDYDRAALAFSGYLTKTTGGPRE